MNKKPLLHRYLVFFSILWLFLIPPVFCQDSPAVADAVIKITRIEKLLEVVDESAQSMSGQGQQSPTMLLRSMLMGTDWIAADRAIVIGATFNPAGVQASDYAALIPFRRPNDDFQANYNAVAGSNYYIVSLPPQSGGVVSDRMEEALAAASLSSPDALISMDVAASQLIERAEPQIKKQLDAIEQQLLQTPEAEVEPKQARQMLESLVKTGREVRNMSLGMDLTDRDFVFFFNLAAIAKSQLAEVFSAAGEEKAVMLAEYESTAPIHFRSQPYDVNKVMNFLDTHFGSFYEQMGIDFNELKDILKYFSGEAAGGVAFNDGGMDIEVIAGLDESKDLPDNYLKSVYLPWLMDYGKAMADYLNQQSPEIQIDSLFQPMPDSEVAGHDVVGVQFNMDQAITDDKKRGEQEMNLNFALRMTRLDSMVLMASDDRRLGRLIKQAEGFKKQKAAGPFMQMRVDLDAYLNGIYQMLPTQARAQAGEVPQMGDLKYSLDMADGELKSRYSLAIDDIKKMAGYFQTLSSQVQGDSKGKQQGFIRPQQEKAAQAEARADKPAPEKASPESQAQQRSKARPDKNDPRYWLNKGQLYATYGNTKRAIEHFKKAIEMAPENSAAFFNLGVSYGEKGRYGQAMDAINQAISLRPEDGDYYYARGWVRLRSGDKGKALDDMKRAAQLGNADAIAYLKSIEAR